MPSPSTTWATCSRAARRRPQRSAADRHGLASRHPADRRQVRRRARRLAALEAMRTLVRPAMRQTPPIEIVNWTNEEGARFAPPMLASGVFAGVFSRDYAYARTDRDGKTFGDELERIGYRGETPGRRAHTLRDVRAAHRARPDPRSGRPPDRRRPGRARRALVRGHGNGPGSSHRRHADDAAQECAARRRAHDRPHRRHRSRASARRGRHRRSDREPAEQPQRRARRGVLHHRFPPPRRNSARRHGDGVARSAARSARRRLQLTLARRASGLSRR